VVAPAECRPRRCELVHEYISDLEEYESDVTAYGRFCLALLKAMKEEKGNGQQTIVENDAEGRER